MFLCYSQPHKSRLFPRSHFKLYLPSYAFSTLAIFYHDARNSHARLACRNKSICLSAKNIKWHIWWQGNLTSNVYNNQISNIHREKYLPITKCMIWLIYIKIEAIYVITITIHCHIGHNPLQTWHGNHDYCPWDIRLIMILSSVWT